jgi:hypothetical protein
VASPEPAVGVFTPAGTCPGRLRRHCVIGCADPGQNPSAVRLGSSRVRGRGLGRTGRGHSAGKTIGDGEQDQRLTAAVTATAAANGYQQRPATAPHGRTIRVNFGYVRPERKVGPRAPRQAPMPPTAGAAQQQSTATSPDNRQPARPSAHRTSRDDGQTPSGAASSGRRGRRASCRGDQRPTTATEEHQGVQLSCPDACAPYTF